MNYPNIQTFKIVHNIMTRIMPSFEIDIKGRSICQDHSDYIRFIDPNKDFFQDLNLDALLTCKTCSHYENDECYFTKSEINEIDKKRLRKFFNPYRCKLCGSHILIMFTVVHKLLQEKNIQNVNVKIPLICCNCYDSINNKEFKKTAGRGIFASIEVVFLSLFFFYLTYIFYTISDSTLYYIIPLILLMLITGYGIIRIRKMLLIIKGLLYYRKFFKQ